MQLYYTKLDDLNLDIIPYMVITLLHIVVIVLILTEVGVQQHPVLSHCS